MAAWEGCPDQSREASSRREDGRAPSLWELIISLFPSSPGFAGTVMVIPPKKRQVH